MTNAPPNVWNQMNYVPPRGQCNYRQSLISPKCPCLRFMLHPLKSSSSYECDGCAHHASFHSMENKAEDEIRKRWEQEASEKAQRDQEVNKRPRKRLREIEYTVASAGATATSGVLTPDDDTASEIGTSKTRGGTKTKKVANRALRTRKPKGDTLGIAELMEDQDCIELD
ncbi:hypothetical protein DM02DRAFT_564457 [Periconia macrospinosa]|uniref:Uncharacterized protein n=1 Tax=Periconia macrospinosa TaxID=97972 RepID=A0A2V1DMX6_9PLEO|nr:hypothetical protein DM02DRAFT_564457 [Periconia macrospinosa]